MDDMDGGDGMDDMDFVDQADLTAEKGRSRKNEEVVPGRRGEEEP